MARSTFVSQNAQNTTISEQLLKFRCSNMARRCGAKQICKSKWSKHLIVGSIFDVAIRKNRTPLWREAHLQVQMVKKPQRGTDFGSFDPEKHLSVKMCKTPHTLGPRFEVPMSKNGTPLWREAHLQVKMYKTPAFCGIFRSFYLTS